jgi:hypothetical protein
MGLIQQPDKGLVPENGREELEEPPNFQKLIFQNRLV